MQMCLCEEVFRSLKGDGGEGCVQGEGALAALCPSRGPDPEGVLGQQSGLAFVSREWKGTREGTLCPWLRSGDSARRRLAAGQASAENWGGGIQGQGASPTNELLAR